MNINQEYIKIQYEYKKTKLWDIKSLCNIIWSQTGLNCLKVFFFWFLAGPLQLKGAAKQNIGKKNSKLTKFENDEDTCTTLGPIPTGSKIFEGLHFLLTCTEPPRRERRIQNVSLGSINDDVNVCLFKIVYLIWSFYARLLFNMHICFSSYSVKLLPRNTTVFIMSQSKF